METLLSSKIKVLEKDNFNTEILTDEALVFLESLHRKFNSRRLDLMDERPKRQMEIDKGVMPYFLPETKSIRDGEWKVAPIPHDLQDRRVEITGPVSRKMIINALNFGAKTFMADFRDWIRDFTVGQSMPKGQRPAIPVTTTRSLISVPR